ncbi:Uridine kinase-like protein 3 [Zea mays]|uniref:Uridine kinase-like protein 3 n=1 Tax=Zea mays TaxID=4577 RepID=A0A3L6FR25_MAIZE|nr:Uridine kinase-like protein 3 [Zea mays]
MGPSLQLPLPAPASPLFLPAVRGVEQVVVARRVRPSQRRFIDKSGTHVIDGVKMGGKDVENAISNLNTDAPIVDRACLAQVSLSPVLGGFHDKMKCKVRSTQDVKFIQFQLTVNVASLIINVVAAVSSGNVPLNAVQVVEHGLGHLPFTEKQVITPTGSVYMGVDFFKKLCGVSIVRSGESMENALRACCKGIKIGKILIHRVGDNGQQPSGPPIDGPVTFITDVRYPIIFPCPSPATAPSRTECSIDLKLGELGEFGAADGTTTKEPTSATAAQCPSCAVDGCKADLSKFRDYHRHNKNGNSCGGFYNGSFMQEVEALRTLGGWDVACAEARCTRGSRSSTRDRSEDANGTSREKLSSRYNFPASARESDAEAGGKLGTSTLDRGSGRSYRGWRRGPERDAGASFVLERQERGP